MIQVNSPGLPPWPKLWFDKMQRKAVVVVRHPTWRSYECAYLATEFVVWMVNGGIAFTAWTVFATPELALRVFFVLMAFIICFPMAALATRSALRDPFARQVFATKTTFWVTENSVIFKSRLYSSPVVVWRQWKDKPIGIKFIVQPDADANRYITDHQQQRKWPRTPINEAAVIELVVSTPTGYDGALPTANGNLQRSIPISEASGRFAQKFSTVFAAALLLVPLEEQKRKPTKSNGVDIDALS